jgi:hypothetical protein
MNSPLRLGGTLLSLWLVLLVGLQAEMVMDDAGRFAIDMAAPQSRSTSEGKDGFVIHLLLHEEGTAAAYMVSYNDLSPGSGGKLDLHGLMLNAMAEFLKSTASKELASGEHALGDIRGWDFTFTENKEAYSGHGRFYLVGDRFYQVIYMGPVNTENSEKSLRFVDSFRLLR